MFSKNTKTLKDLLDTYSNLNLMKIRHVVLNNINYHVNKSFKYFLRTIWGVWSFEKKIARKLKWHLKWYKLYFTFSLIKTLCFINLKLTYCICEKELVLQDKKNIQFHQKIKNIFKIWPKTIFDGLLNTNNFIFT